MPSILDKNEYPEFWRSCRTTAFGTIGGSAFGTLIGTCQAVVNSKSIPKYAITTGVNFGMLSCCFFGLREILAYARSKRDVWNNVAAGASSGFISFAAYGGPRFGILGTVILSSVAYCGHYVGEKVDFAKEEFIRARRLHLRKERMNAKFRGDYEVISSKDKTRH